MNKEGIIEGNKLIAEFMGAAKSDYGDYMVFFVTNPACCGKINHKDIKYHNSWDWLMPVIDKIESKGFHVFMYNDEDGYMFQVFKAAYSYKRKPEDIILCHNLPSTKTETRIGIYWEGVIEFIKWYNQQQPT